MQLFQISLFSFYSTFYGSGLSLPSSSYSRVQDHQTKHQKKNSMKRKHDTLPVTEMLITFQNSCINQMKPWFKRVSRARARSNELEQVNKDDTLPFVALIFSIKHYPKFHYFQLSKFFHFPSPVNPRRYNGRSSQTPHGHRAQAIENRQDLLQRRPFTEHEDMAKLSRKGSYMDSCMKKCAKDYEVLSHIPYPPQSS